MSQLDNKIAIVTGASQGIGKAIAIRFSQEGAKVIITARNRSGLKSVANQISAIGHQALVLVADLGVYKDINRIVANTISEYGRIDILVNNAGIIHPPIDLIDLKPELWNRVIKVNYPAASCGAFKNFRPTVLAEYFWHSFGSVCIVL